MRIFAVDVRKREGREVELAGWVHRLREIGNKFFIVLRDASGTVQVVARKESVKGKLDVEASVRVRGVVRRDERAPGGYEVHATSVEVIGESAPDWPFHRYLSTEMQLDYRHLWVRSTKMQRVMKVKHTALEYAWKWFRDNEFWFVTPPIFVSSACEGGATLFEVPYFNTKAYLSQSAQLYLEALIYSLERVWSLTPSFRAEKSRTRRHLTEYWHLEAEEAFVDFEGNMKIQEELLKAMMKGILDERSEEVAEFKTEEKLEDWIKEKWPRITYEEALEIVNRKGGKMKWGDDPGADEERMIMSEFETPVFVTHWPREIKAFYMKVDEKDEKVVLGSDLLAPPVGEIIGGSEREWKLELLLENMKIQKLDPKEYEWYLDLRRYGSVPHSGFGMGMERFVMAVLNLEHIRDALPFPRFINRVWP